MKLNCLLAVKVDFFLLFIIKGPVDSVYRKVFVLCQCSFFFFMMHWKLMEVDKW